MHDDVENYIVIRSNRFSECDIDSLNVDTELR